MAEPVGAAAVEARRAVRLFGTTPALVQADLVVPTGTVSALVGANGAGKTTLLRLIATALRPTSGTVLVHGHDVATEGAAVRGLVELLPAAGGAYQDLSALENLRFAAGMRGLDVRTPQLADALGRVGLGAVGDELARTFSTGMLRRLALARLVLTRPRLALLDEPYGGLDDEGQELVDGLLLEIRSDGRTALLATHERVRVERIADSVYRVAGGVVSRPKPEGRDLEEAAMAEALR